MATNKKVYENIIKIMNAQGVSHSLPTTYDVDALRDYLNSASSNDDVNAFYETLENVLGRQFYEFSGKFENRLKMFKKGMLPLGKTVQGLFVEKAKTVDYDVNDDAGLLLKRQHSAVFSTYYNDYQEKMWETSTSRQNAKLAFLTEGGLDTLTAQIFQSMYEGKEANEYDVMKKALSVAYQGGYVYPVACDKVTDERSAKDLMIKAQAMGENWMFYNTIYNYLGVERVVNLDRQVILMTPLTKAQMNIDVLAMAFQIDKAELMQRIIVVDNFGKTPEGNLLSEIEMMLVDEDFVQFWDALEQTDTFYNGRLMMWNNFLHHHYNVGVSPFANCVAFVTVGSIGAVTIEGSASTPKNTVQQYKANVVNDNSNYVNWEVTAPSGVNLLNTTISKNGVLIVDSAYAGASVTIKATSLLDPTKSATKNVTVS